MHVTSHSYCGGTFVEIWLVKVQIATKTKNNVCKANICFAGHIKLEK